MKKSSQLLLIGGILVVIGFVVPFMMVADVIPKALWLEMIIAIVQVVGLGMGIMGSVIMTKNRRDKNKKY
ncbi:MAG: hypothetical protein AB1Z23_02430 [Eubacteriales bacterium]